MTLWIDAAQLSPALASWFQEHLLVDAVAVRDLRLRDATDAQIFEAARAANAVVLTKDRDFVQLLEQRGAPPRIVWLTCGNTSTQVLRTLLDLRWPTVRQIWIVERHSWRLVVDPKLHNNEWQSALDEALPHLGRFQEQLNAISEDLRVLEKALIDSGFRIETEIEFDYNERLAWADTGKNAWRIYLSTWLDQNERHLRPLIETPAVDRWRAASAVPALLTEIAAVAKRHHQSADEPEPKAEILTDDDIPF